MPSIMYLSHCYGCSRFIQVIFLSERRVVMSKAEPSNDGEETIPLDQFLKLADLVASGGEAKHVIRSGVVLVNGDSETRRGRKLIHGDVVTFSGEDYVIETTDDE